MKCDSTVEGGRTVIHVFYRKFDGRRGHIVDRDFKSYFFVSANEVARANDLRISSIASSERGMKVGDPSGEPLVSIESDFSGDVPRLRAGFASSWEANVFVNNRYLIDKVKKCLDESAPLLLPLDIECVQEDGKDVIVCIGFYSYRDKKYYSFYLPWGHMFPSLPPSGTIKLQEGVDVTYELRQFGSELALLDAFVQSASTIGPPDSAESCCPDVYLGWNVHYDLTTIYTSCERNRVSIKGLSPLGEVRVREGFRGRKELYIGGCSVFDECAAAIDILPPQEGGFTLRNIASKFIGFEKKDYRRKIQWLRENDPDELIRYNLGDVYSCVALMEVKQLFSYYYERSVEASCNLEETFPMWKWLEHLLLKRSRLRLPTHLESEPVQCQGPRILETSPGIHDNVVCFDFKGLYLAIVRTWNMSPETFSKDGDLKIGNGSAYLSSPEGVWVDLVSFLQDRKNLYDDQLKALHLSEAEKLKHPIYHRRNGYKIASVATTGLFKWEGFRLYMPQILNDIYFIAREVVDYVVAKVQSWGYKVLYGDTDSAFIVVDSLFEQVPDLLGKMNSAVAEFCRSKGIETHHFLIEEDYRFKSLFFDAGQKRYAGILDNGELLVQGFEGKKINVSDIGRGIQNKLLRIILDTRDKQVASDFVKSMVKQVKPGGESLSKLAFYHAFKKRQLSDYKVQTSQLRGFHFSNFFRGSSEWPLLDWRDTHKYLPIKIISVSSSLEKSMKLSNIDWRKVHVIAFDVDDDVDSISGFLNYIHMKYSGKLEFKVDFDKILDLNVTRRVVHVVSALGWDFTGVLPSKGKVRKRSVNLGVGQRQL